MFYKLNLYYPGDQRFSAENFANQPILNLLAAERMADQQRVELLEGIGHLTSRIGMLQLARVDDLNKTLAMFNPFFTPEPLHAEIDAEVIAVLKELVTDRKVPEWVWDFVPMVWVAA